MNEIVFNSTEEKLNFIQDMFKNSDSVKKFLFAPNVNRLIKNELDKRSMNFFKNTSREILNSTLTKFFSNSFGNNPIGKQFAKQMAYSFSNIIRTFSKPILHSIDNAMGNKFSNYYNKALDFTSNFIDNQRKNIIKYGIKTGMLPKQFENPIYQKRAFRAVQKNEIKESRRLQEKDFIKTLQKNRVLLRKEIELGKIYHHIEKHGNVSKYIKNIDTNIANIKNKLQNKQLNEKQAEKRIKVLENMKKHAMTVEKKMKTSFGSNIDNMKAYARIKKENTMIKARNMKTKIETEKFRRRDTMVKSSILKQQKELQVRYTYNKDKVNKEKKLNKNIKDTRDSLKNLRKELKKETDLDKRERLQLMIKYEENRLEDLKQQKSPNYLKNKIKENEKIIKNLEEKSKYNNLTIKEEEDLKNAKFNLEKYNKNFEKYHSGSKITGNIKDYNRYIKDLESNFEKGKIDQYTYNKLKREAESRLQQFQKVKKDTRSDIIKNISVSKEDLFNPENIGKNKIDIIAERQKEAIEKLRKSRQKLLNKAKFQNITVASSGTHSPLVANLGRFNAISNPAFSNKKSRFAKNVIK